MTDAPRLPGFPPPMVRGGRFDGPYRYTLHRTWEPERPRVTFVMLNPSLADAERDDPTVRRCVAFARCWGFGALAVVNLFALIAPYPTALQGIADPIGPHNDEAIREWTQDVLTVVAWGEDGDYADRAADVLPTLGEVYCLGVTRSGAPRHPLYLRRDTPPRPYSPGV